MCCWYTKKEPICGSFFVFVLVIKIADYGVVSGVERFCQKGRICSRAKRVPLAHSAIKGEKTFLCSIPSRGIKLYNRKAKDYLDTRSQVSIPSRGIKLYNNNRNSGSSNNRRFQSPLGESSYITKQLWVYLKRKHQFQSPLGESSYITIKTLAHHVGEYAEVSIPSRGIKLYNKELNHAINAEFTFQSPLGESSYITALRWSRLLPLCVSIPSRGIKLYNDLDFTLPPDTEVSIPSRGIKLYNPTNFQAAYTLAFRGVFSGRLLFSSLK